ncbi:MAG: hypothetical protein IT299_13405 [Dehalococcoidia bacterium]|nr:hypothetical protein [Dehalococcoidia bacterium]
MTLPLDPRRDASQEAAPLGDFAAVMRLESAGESRESPAEAPPTGTTAEHTDHAEAVEPAETAATAATGATALPVATGAPGRSGAAAEPPDVAAAAGPSRAASEAPPAASRVPSEREQPATEADRTDRAIRAPATAPAPRRASTAARASGARTPASSAAPVARSTPEGLIVTPQVLLLGLVGTLFILMFTLIEPSPRWVVLLGTATTTFGMEGVLRSGRRQAFAEGGLDTAPFLLMPALYMLVVPVFIEHATLGFATPFSGLFAGIGYAALVIGTLSSVREFDPARDRGRLIAASATYFVAFALFALVFLFGVGQRPATIAVALASVVLAAEILREGEIDPAETLLYSLVVGVVIGETRWVLHYLPIDAYAGALTLLLAFYISTGLLHSYVVRALTREVARTYATVGIAGVVFIAAARGVGLA